MHRRTWALLIVAALTAACSDDSATEPSQPGASSPSTAPAASTPPTVPATVPPTVPATLPPTTGPAGLDDGWSVTAALGEVPDSGSASFELSTADLAGIADLIGAARPDLSAGAEAVIDTWVLPLTFPSVDVEYRDVPVWVNIPPPVMPAVVAEVERFDELLGWSIVDVDAFVHYQPEPPGYFAVVAGGFADDALAGLPPVADGVVATAAGDELAPDLAGEMVVDQLGRPVRLARVGDRIALSLTTAPAEQWLAGPAATLADDPGLAAAAAALDAAGVLDAQLFRHDFAFDPVAVVGAAGSSDAIAAVAEAFAEGGVDTAFDTVGIGWTVTDAGAPRVIIAYVTPGEADAASLAEQLDSVYTTGTSFVTAAPLTELLGADTFDIDADGNVVTVAYEPVERPWSTAIDMIYRRDLPFLHG